MKTFKTSFFCIFLLLVNSIDLFSQSIAVTVHNLSVSGPGTVKATDGESEICLFCHTPHNSNPSPPLWNRSTPGSIYTLYSSSTMQALPGQPDGASILCLSCHDGTVALGNVLSRATPIDFAPLSTMPVGTKNLSTDLRDDHPVSFVYDAALATADRQLLDPVNIPHPVGLTKEKVQCTSCHDPHTNNYTDFLVSPTRYSELCVSCHQLNNWNQTSHNTSTKTWNSAAPNPWTHSPWTTVAENGCENCHNPHSSGGTPRIMNYQHEEDNCLNCHNGNVSGKDIQADINKTFSHNVYGYLGVHDPTEAATVATKHVECVDCHNPHSSKDLPATAPAVKGFNAGVMGIDQSGAIINPVNNEYEICYRCHANTPATAATTPRQIVQNNVRLEFDPGNPSYHPIVAAGVNSTITGLIATLSSSSIIYCTDCHASSSSSLNGPHGSIYPQILKYDFDRTDTYNPAYTAYELCYQCHVQSTTLTKHALLSVSGTHGTMTSCNTCHDPHGIYSGDGGTTANNSFLVNFNTNVVSANGGGQLKFTTASPGHGSCDLKCHNHNHSGSSY